MIVFEISFFTVFNDFSCDKNRGMPWLVEIEYI